MSYTIAHTERTWGDDIQALLARETTSIFKKESKATAVFDISVVFLALGFLSSGLIVPDYIEQLIRENSASQLLLDLGRRSSEVSLANIDAKLNLAITLLDPLSQFHKVGVWYRVISFIAGVALAVFTVVIFERETPSFIVITKEDKSRLAELKEKNKSSFLKKLAAFVGAISAGVAGNYLYYYLNL